MKSEPVFVRAARHGAYQEQAYGQRASGLVVDQRRIERLIEVIDGVLNVGPRARVPVCKTAAVRASLHDAECARRIAREAGREARRGA